MDKQTHEGMIEPIGETDCLRARLEKTYTVIEILANELSCATQAIRELRAQIEKEDFD